MEARPMPRSTPEGEGIPSRAIERYLRALRDQGMYMHSVMFVRHGKIVSEAYFKPFGPDFRHRLYSCSKSFVSVAIGLLAEQGLIGLDDKCVDYFPELSQGADEYLRETTVRDLLRMAAPYTRGSNYSPRDPSWEKTFFTDEVSHVPGTVFSYCTSGTTILCAIIKRVTGKDFLDVLRPVFDEIGVSDDIFCVETPEGIQWGGSGVCATPRDFAKFANLCMHYGLHEGKRLLPRDYMMKATSRQIDNSLYAGNPDAVQGYGYQFWMLRNEGFAFFGMGGQYALCFPKKDFMIVTTGYEELMMGSRLEIFGALWREVFPEIRDEPLPADEGAAADLQKYVDFLALAHAEGEPDSPVRAQIDKKTYLMGENAMGMKRVRFDFSDGEVVMRYENATGAHALRFGLLKNVAQEFAEVYSGRRVGVPMGRGYDCFCSAAWTAEDTLMLNCHVADIYLGQLRMAAAFKANTLTLNAVKNAEWFLDEYQGFASGAYQGK